MAEWIEHEPGGRMRPPAGGTRATRTPLAKELWAMFDAAKFDQLIVALLPHVVEAVAERLRSRIPDEARAMAEAATATPGLDEVSLAALADWLEERGLGVDGAKVRALAVRDGDLLVIECGQSLRPDARTNIRQSLEAILAGRGVTVVVLDGGMKLQHIPLANKPERG